MTIVFGGLDIPIFEIIFMISLLLIIGLVILIFAIIYILRELRALKGALSEEQQDVAELDKDIKILDKISGKKNSADAKQKVKQYIHTGLSRGQKWPEIKKTLISKGWTSATLDRWYKEK
ncbi:hypothetical protein GOV09_01700 [Candidatus Woesearchaeota archaeon]|nr:hypothetical protein [Candidatus Woesearchaeota archaeon]